MSEGIIVRVPATTANLGPGFDCLALALDLWNEAEFFVTDTGVVFEVEGEGKGRLPTDEQNLIYLAAQRLSEMVGRPLPVGLRVKCNNAIPMGSGLGSSAAAVLMGLMGANALLGNPADMDQILALATEMEGHPDNVAAALLGGLVVVNTTPEGVLARKVQMHPLKVVVVVPNFDLSTHAAREALPKMVSMQDAVFNIGRAVMVVEALRSGDLHLLGQVMQDRMHQPYRLGLIPGAGAALMAASQAGAQAVALSGAGPGVIAFAAQDWQPIAQAMLSEFSKAGLVARAWELTALERGVTVI